MTALSTTVRSDITPLPGLIVVIHGTVHRAARREDDGDVTWSCSDLDLAAAYAGAYGVKMAQVEACLGVEAAELGSMRICRHCKPIAVAKIEEPDELPFDMEKLTDLPTIPMLEAPAGFVERVLDQVDRMFGTSSAA